MTTKDKYREVLNMGMEFGIRDGYVEEEGSTLKIGGVAKTQYEKDKMWDKIKEIGGEKPVDIVADIKVENNEIYHRHTVASGESLSKIAKQYYGDPMKYMAIFNANTDLLKNPDLIHPGQELVIPNL